MTAWWRKEPLSEIEQSLLDQVIQAHTESAHRGNASTVALVNAAGGSGDVGRAIIAAISTLGSKHAPLEQTYEFLSANEPELKVGTMLYLGLKVPGWGGTFQKEKPDPIWVPVYLVLHEHWPELAKKIYSVTTELFKYNKKIHPNPSAYTAATALALGLPAKLAVYLFISSRLDAWARIAYSNVI